MSEVPPPMTTPVPRHIRTRRQLYLSAHPSYYEQASHALSLPLAYDRLVRRYQTVTERETEGKQQGWAKLLEGALLRGEAKRESAVNARQQELSKEHKRTEEAEAADLGAYSGKGLKALPEEMHDVDGDTETQGREMKESRNGLDEVETNEQTMGQAWDLPLGLVPPDEMLEPSPEPLAHEPEHLEIGVLAGPAVVVDGVDKRAAQRRWQHLLRSRFVAGDDEEFDYVTIDQDDALDRAWHDARREEEWFEDDPENWSDDGTERGRRLEGETGIQDF